MGLFALLSNSFKSTPCSLVVIATVPTLLISLHPRALLTCSQLTEVGALKQIVLELERYEQYTCHSFHLLLDGEGNSGAVSCSAASETACEIEHRVGASKPECGVKIRGSIDALYVLLFPACLMKKDVKVPTP